MIVTHSGGGVRAGRNLVAGLARSESDVREAQRLRWRVFAGEQGARLGPCAEELDVDRFDRYCEHLIVRDLDCGEVVGTYRILPPSGARAAGGYYSEQEFDLRRIDHLRPGLVEVGRSCIHPDYRGGAVISLLWSGLADWMLKQRHEHLMGCASVPMNDGGLAATAVWLQAARSSLAPLEYRVFPHCPMPLRDLPAGFAPAIPPLVKGYLRLGAWVCGEPAWDPDFNVADLPVLLPLARVEARYARHFFNAHPRSPAAAERREEAEPVAA
jgi:putative hemolysin